MSLLKVPINYVLAEGAINYVLAEGAHLIDIDYINIHKEKEYYLYHILLRCIYYVIMSYVSLFFTYH